MTPYIHFGAFTWNLDSSVGKGGQNSVAADVSYIQWYYWLAAKNPKTPPDRQAIYRLVNPTGSFTGACTGRDDDPLVRAIMAHQQALSHPYVDGRISVARGEGKLGEKAFFILRLSARLADMFPDQWPRLDRIERCPPSVAEAMKKAVPKI
ncbi:MAG: hypothetical protein J0H41_04855 [Rhizobiales bacterium]|nr:hypothetical protein [Hyphomicrobiales bacterium]